MPARSVRDVKPVEVHPDPCPDLLVERGPDNKGVGSWVPSDKHRLLSHYLDASQHAWRRWGHRVLIDPFGGPGRIQVKGENFTRDGGAVVAWRTLHRASTPFTQMLVGDLQQERARACADRLSALGAHSTPFAGPAVDTIRTMVSAVPTRGSLTLAYIDRVELDAGWPLRAMPSLERAAHLLPLSAAPPAALSQARCFAGQKEAADHAARRAVELDPARSDGVRFLAMSAYAAGELAPAVEAYRQALERHRPVSLTSGMNWLGSI